MPELKMEKTELERYKEILEKKKAKALKNIEYLEEVMSEESSDTCKFGVHMADRSTDTMQQEKNCLFAQRGEKYLKQLNIALSRIKDETYGVCYFCDPPHFINTERLDAIPTTIKCSEAKAIIKKQEKPNQSSLIRNLKPALV